MDMILRGKKAASDRESGRVNCQTVWVKKQRKRNYATCPDTISQS